MKRFLMVLFSMVMIPYVTTLGWTGRVDSQGTGWGNGGGYDIFGGVPDPGSLPEDERMVVARREDRELAVPMEEFLIGVTAAQIPAEYGLETIKAQAILARTWILREMEGESRIYEEALDLDILTRQQMEDRWGEEKFAEYYGKIRTAVEETKGTAVFYEGSFIEPLFCRASAGKTRSGGEEYPYLPQAESPGDVEADGYLTVIRLTPEQLAGLVTGIPGSIKVEASELPEGIQIAQRDGAGYVLQIQVGKKTYGGEEISRALDLPSACFSIDGEDGEIRITAKGVGHGYGFSQAGANAMERDGAGYEELLRHYFQNVEIKSGL